MILQVPQSDLIILGVTLTLAIIIIFVSLHYYNKNVNVRRYRKKLKYILKMKEKKYNANVLIDLLYNKYTTDQTNTYERLQKKGKKKFKKYFKFYKRELSELVEAKSNISPNKRKNKLLFVIKNQNNETIGKYGLNQKFKKIKKLINKHQILFDMIAYLYELPNYIDSEKAYHLENHDNKHIITYQIVESYA